MLAEAIHSVADSGNQVLLLIGGRRAKKGMPEHRSATAVERYIFALHRRGGAVQRRRSVRAVRGVPQVARDQLGDVDALVEGGWWWVPLVVRARRSGGGLSFRTGCGSPTARAASRARPKFIRSAKAPGLPVVLLEDFAALIGLAFASSGSC